MSVRRERRGISSAASGRALLACVLLALAGCAPMTTTPPAGTPAPPQGGGAPPPATTPGTLPSHPAVPAGAAIDSGPSPEAVRVLERIPEPLTPEQQALNPPVPALKPFPAAAAPDTAAHRVMPAPEAAADTLRIEREADGGGAGVPVPAPTQPLGSQQGSPVTLADTSAATSSAAAATPPATPPAGTAVAPSSPPAAGATPATPPPAAAPPETVEPHAGTPGGSEPCWRMQVAAKPARADAQTRLDAAQSLLVIPMAMVSEKGFFKVRTRDCFSREAAEALKKRAIESGFADVFLVDTNAPPPRPAQHRRVPPSRRKR